MKRRDATTGLYESDWQDISKYIIRYGSITRSIDDVRLNKFRIGAGNLTVDNNDGKFNTEDFESSLWYGYMPRTRTLIKLEAGYRDTLGSGYTEYPTIPTIFVGVIADEMVISDNNQINIPIKSIIQVLNEFPASSITKWTTTNWKASDIIGSVRDQTDGSGSLIFQQWISSSGWNIDATTINYDYLNTSTCKELKDLSVWDMVEKLAEAENKIAYISLDGDFYFTDRAVVSATSWKFYGLGTKDDPDYGNNIIKISKYYEAIDKLYQHVSLRYASAETSTSWIETQTTFQVSGTNDGWKYGIKTYSLENYWVADATQATNIVNNIYGETATLKSEIEFDSLLIPHLDILNYSEVTYESKGVGTSLWDKMIWDVDRWESGFDNFQLQGEEFKILSVKHNLDRFTSTWHMREL